MADVNNNAKLRDLMGVPFYPMVVDSDGVDMKITLNNLKNLINGLQTSITNINTDIDNVEGDLNSLLDELNAYIEAINKRIAGLEGGGDDLDTTGLMRIYSGPADLYVNHKYTGGDNQGTQTKPFSSFAQLNVFLQNSKTINKAVTVHILTAGQYTEHLGILDFSGSGKITYDFNTNGEFNVSKSSNTECGIKAVGVKIPLLIQGYRVHNSVHGILFYRCDDVEVTNTIVNPSGGYGILCSDTNGYVHTVDFANSYCCICAAESSSNVYSLDCNGNGVGDAFRAISGGTVHYGTTTRVTTIPKGLLNEESGKIFKSGDVTPHDSLSFPPTVNPPAPPTTSDYTASFNATGLGTYQYQWSNWSAGECKSGVYSSYGDKAGHIFFDIAAIRSFLSSGTVIDGATITLTRANSGGTSAAVDIWVGGSSCSGASGTPSYGNKVKVGQLAWGQTKTFTLTKAIVDGLKNGAYNSITTHGSAYSTITACNIILKVNK